MKDCIPILINTCKSPGRLEDNALKNTFLNLFPEFLTHDMPLLSQPLAHDCLLKINLSIRTPSIHAEMKNTAFPPNEKYISVPRESGHTD